MHGGKLRVQPKSNRPTPATERAIAASLAEPDFDLELPPEASDKYSLKSGAVRAHVWPVLVQQCGWCKTSGETLKLTKVGREMLQNASPEAFRGERSVWPSTIGLTNCTASITSAGKPAEGSAG